MPHYEIYIVYSSAVTKLLKLITLVVCKGILFTAKCAMLKDRDFGGKTPPIAPSARVHRSSCRGANQEVGPPNGSNIRMYMEGGP